LGDLKLNKNEYILVSAHRQENIDFKSRFNSFIATLEDVSKVYKLPILVSTHPRTRKQIDAQSISKDFNIKFHEPFNFTDYNNLQKNAFIVLSDSGTISEESAMLGFKAVTIRDSMERPEALEAGSIVMSGTKSENVLQAIDLVLKNQSSSSVPIEYQVSDVSNRVLNFIASTVHQHNFWNSLYND
jgi:UDP-N-acetylglucosamine 2-epimerase (non-hydrolysing)